MTASVHVWPTKGANSSSVLSEVEFSAEETTFRLCGAGDAGGSLTLTSRAITGRFLKQSGCPDCTLRLCQSMDGLRFCSHGIPSMTIMVGRLDHVRCQSIKGFQRINRLIPSLTDPAVQPFHCRRPPSPSVVADVSWSWFHCRRAVVAAEPSSSLHRRSPVIVAVIPATPSSR